MIVYLAALFVITGIGVAVWALKPQPTLFPAAPEATDVAPSSRDLDLQRSANERLFQPAAAVISGATSRFLPSGVLDKIGRNLRIADLDRRWSPEMVLGAQVVGFAVSSLLSMIYLSGQGVSRNSIFVCAILVVGGTLGPDLKVKRVADDRRKVIGNELPDVLDQLTVTVEAGMSFDGAMLRAGQEGRGLMAVELLKAVNDMQLGLSRGEALQAMAERTDVADLRQFVTAVRQAEKHGFPLANILRLQSLELRDKRRARAEERAMQVPVKITFPLVFCILPALFIVIMAPAAIRIASGF